MYDPNVLDPSASPTSRAPRHEAGLFGALLPRKWEALVARGIGVAGLLAAAFAALALVSWNAADPSVTHARAGEPENWMGFAGASVADVAMQLFGLAAPIGLLLLAVRAWQRVRFGLEATDGVRGLAAVGATAFTAALVGCMPLLQSWPFTVPDGSGGIGLGGIVGDTILALPRAVTGHWPSGLWALLLAALHAAPAIWLARFATNVPAAHVRRARDVPFDEAAMDDTDEEPGALSRIAGYLAAPMGLLMHLSYSLRSTLRRRVVHVVREARAREAMRRDEAARVEAGFAADDGVPSVAAVRREPFVGPDDAASALDDGVMQQTFADRGEVEIRPVEGGLRAAMRRAATTPSVAVPDMEQSPIAGDTPFDVFEDDGWAELDDSGEPRVNPSRFTTPLVHPLAPKPDDAPLPPMPPKGQVHAAPMIETPGAAAPAPAEPLAVPASPAGTTTTRRKVGPPAGAPETFELPALDLLAPARKLVSDPAMSAAALEDNARRLEGVLGDFGVKGAIINVRPGPVVTLYELEPAPGIKSSRVIGLADDIARSMEAISARVAVVPGRNAIGIELPNQRRETVFLSEQLKSPTFTDTKAKLGMALGKTIGGEPVVTDLAKMPHLLVAGTTGSGKSVAINTMILSLLYRHGPDKCRLIMVDPKMVELSVYDGIPHLLTPVVTDPKKAVVALKWTVREMEQRYAKMSKVGVRNVDGFNQRVREAEAKGEKITRTVQTGYDHDTGEALYETEEFDLEAMPYIVVIIDEVADLMMVAGKEIEGAVQRLGQMARAAGIHVIMATQRPSTDVITGTIKANFPTRISFQVTSKIDSRVMLGEAGAEQLLGMGDMLHMAGGGRIERVHGPFVSDDEVEKIVAHLKLQGVPDYLDAITQDDEEEDEDGAAAAGGGGATGGMEDSDDPYDQAVAVVLRDRKVSTSYIQRRLGIGYNRAASLIERMEEEGLIGPANHAGKREILVPAEDETI